MGVDGVEKKGDGDDRCSIWSLQACWPHFASVENSAIRSGNTDLDTDNSTKPPSKQVIESSIAVKLEAAAQVFTKVDEKLVLSSELRQFSFDSLKSATRNFCADSFLGEGGFGCVFKGWIDEHGTTPVRPGTGLAVAVKILNQSGMQGHKEWLTEIYFLGQFHHPHLVKLIGFCIEENQRLLVYEFMERGSLENHLFRRWAFPVPWNVRMKIALGAAKGLEFLHSGSNGNKPVIYRDFKTSNILLNMDFTAKLSDFGLAKDGPEGDETHVSTRVMGTFGYAAPEYIMTGHLTNKTDVYSFGVVLLELLTGRQSIDKNRPGGQHSLAEWARPYLTDRRKLPKIMDTHLNGRFSVKGSQIAGNLAYRCLSKDPKMRPLMDEVVELLNQIQNLQDMANATYASSQQVKQSMSPVTAKTHENIPPLQENPAQT